MGVAKRISKESLLVKNPEINLSRREREIMRIIYKNDNVSVSEILSNMDDPPSQTAMRTHLRILEKKGYVVSSKNGKANIYKTKIPRAKVAGPVLQGVLDSFFGGSIVDAVASHLTDPNLTLDPEEVAKLQILITQRSKRKS